MQGPFFTTIGDSRHQRLTRRWFRTDKGVKTRSPLPFESTNGITLSGPADKLQPIWIDAQGNPRSGLNIASRIHGYYVTTDAWNRLNVRMNKSVRKFQEKAGEKIQLGVDYAERRKTFAQVTQLLQVMKNPAMSLAAYAKSLARGRKYRHSPIETFYNVPMSRIVDPRTPGPSRSSRETQSVVRSLSKDAGNAWLAWHFGIKPLAQEISGALKFWQDERPVRQLIKTSTRDDSNYWMSDSPGSWGLRHEMVYRGWARCAGVVEEVNPFTVSLDALGLLNPFSIALELMPYSFIWGGWLYPLDLYVSSMFGFMPGYRITNQYRTYFIKGKHTIYHLTTPLYDQWYGVPFTGRSYAVRRELLVAPVVQKTLNPWSESRERFLTSAALLQKIFKF